MMIFTPYRRHQLDLSPEQFNFQNFPLWNSDQMSPMLSNSGGLMMGAMFSSHTFGDFMNTQAVGPAEAFFPVLIEGEETDEDSPDNTQEDEAERRLKISDFITLDDGDSVNNDDDEDDPWSDGQRFTPRPSTAGSDGELLSHLTPATVASFRRNQLNQQLMMSTMATQDSLVFSGPYNHTAVKGLKSDRFQTAGAPLTPIRRHKKQLSDLGRSPTESVSQKRKASGEHFGHKRQRSISDVNALRI
jgi:hypothetical protein